MIFIRPSYVGVLRQFKLIFSGYPKGSVLMLSKQTIIPGCSCMSPTTLAELGLEIFLRWWRGEESESIIPVTNCYHEK